MKPIRLSNIKKILVIRNDGIGDLLNATPAIELLRRNYPDAAITVLASRLNASVLIGNPHVDDVLVFERQRRLKDKLQFFYRLRQARFDLAVAMRTAAWSNFTAWVSGARYRLGRYHKRFRRTLTHTWRGTYNKGSVHEVDRNLELVRLVCEGAGERRLVMNLLDEEVAHAKNTLADWGVAPSDFLVGIHPGGSSFDKRWPEENFAAVADSLFAQYGAKILLLRGPDEAALERNILKRMQTPPIYHAPQSVRELAALIQQCRLFVCNDSGPMHIAAALSVPTVAIFGPTDHVVWRPLNASATVVRRDMPCWPCSAHKCKIGWECTKKLSIAPVWQRIVQRIECNQ